VKSWITTSDQQHLVAAQPDIPFATDTAPRDAILVDETQRYQPIRGFGASLTDSAAWLIAHTLSAEQRDALLHRLFDAQTGIGLNVLRLPMGACDLNLPEGGNYSYDDVPPGQTDPDLRQFSIAHDEAYIIPVLTQIRQINPRLQIIASPWSAPAWMKANDSLEQGRLLPEHYAAYAHYFVTFLQAYQAHGIPVTAITMQNEPKHIHVGYPGMQMLPEEQAAFIKGFLGPAFARHGIPTQILIYDHDWDDPVFPETVLRDPDAARYVHGIAWHWYSGDVSAQSQVHDRFPAQETYVTEASGGEWEGEPNWPIGLANGGKLLIDAMRHWAGTVLRWGLALDTHHGPHMGRGDACTQCRGVVIIDQATGEAANTADFYSLAHASTFLQPGAYRIASNSDIDGIIDVAWVNPDGAKVLLVANTRNDPRPVRIHWRGQTATTSLPGGALATYRWT
jgi:glucosylceramidase